MTGLTHEDCKHGDCIAYSSVVQAMCDFYGKGKVQKNLNLIKKKASPNEFSARTGEISVNINITSLLRSSQSS